MHPSLCCDYTPAAGRGCTGAAPGPHPAVTRQQDPGISQPRFPPIPTSAAGWMENVANCCGLTHTGAGEAPRVPGTHVLPHEDVGCCHRAWKVAHVAPSKAYVPPMGMTPELPHPPGAIGEVLGLPIHLLQRADAMGTMAPGRQQIPANWGHCRGWGDPVSGEVDWKLWMEATRDSRRTSPVS